MALTVRRAPEVIQTSWLDCGTASLTSILRGLGAPAPYDRLRVMCNTGIDGTSIDSIEQVALSAGVDAVQMVVPVEQLLAYPERYLPAIVVTVLPDGFAHFVVAWSSRRRRVHIMDPATGRRTPSHRRFASELYMHELVVPASAWQEWAEGEDFQEGLRRRCESAGVAPAQVPELVRRAHASDNGLGLAVLDAALRAEQSSPQRGGHAHRAEVFDRIAFHLRTDGVHLDPQWWACVLTADADGEAAPTIAMKGAVVLAARSWQESAIDPEIREALTTPEPHPMEAVRTAVSKMLWLPIVLAVGAVAVAAAQTSQILQLRSLFRPEGFGFASVLAAVLALLLLRALTSAGSLKMGRDLDSHIRESWLKAPDSLHSAFIRSRPVSDIVFRSHSTHRLREFPGTGFRLLSAAILSLACTVVIIASAPTTLVPATALCLLSVGIPWIFSRSLIQADLRAQTLSGCLARPVADVLLGAQSLRQRSAAPGIIAEHDVLAVGWERALRVMNRITALSRVCAGVAAAAALGWCLSLADVRDPWVAMSILVLGLVVLDAGGLCASSLQSLPAVRSTLLRQSGPLSAVRAGRPRPLKRPDNGIAVSMKDVTVLMGSVTVLDHVDLDISTGEHLAVVGSTGSGKSTLLSVMLGTTDTSSGTISYAASSRRSIRAWSSPASWLWDGTVAENITYSSAKGSLSMTARLEAVGVSRPDEFALRHSGEGGALLSDGEAQRVRLARAIGRPDASFVVLDEAFRGLPRSERSEALRSVRDVWAGATLVCALHEIEDATTFDRVLVIESGRIVEIGRPADLLANHDSRFRQLRDASHFDLPQWTSIRIDSP